ncbi:hypothetical protein KIN20_031712 [Parelaphostrongylus tenuis]|uniref:CWH43-like N-terminal domain-containing protein n=1 Tax=Parelaphostrongylus tenuis TaxID=148309 RepID=A0AAD5R5R5_PARTN|nr:hypothetical protein KIN20_031712 [Parelaphostrongylus tenuis]
MVSPFQTIMSTLGFHLSAFLTLYFIHRTTVQFYDVNYRKNFDEWRWFSLGLMILGWVATCGALIVASFQEGPQLVTHSVGAIIFFFGVMIYFWGQIIIACALKPRMVPLALINFRILLNLLATALLVFHMTCLYARPFVKPINGTKPHYVRPSTGIQRHTKGDQFYDNWLAATTSEWTMALVLSLHLLTYAYDLGTVASSTPQNSQCGSVVKKLCNESSSDQMCGEQTAMIYTMPSNRGLRRVNPSYITDGYQIPQRALPRTSIPVISTSYDRYQYF